MCALQFIYYPVVLSLRTINRTRVVHVREGMRQHDSEGGSGGKSLITSGSGG